MARQDYNTLRHKKAFLAAYATSGNITDAAKAAGVTRQAHYEWKRADPDYAADFKRAGIEAVESLEAEARRRALAGSDTMLIFLLKAVKPKKYRDNVRHEHTGKNGGPIQTVDLSRLSDRELDELERIASKAGGRIAVEPGSN